MSVHIETIRDGRVTINGVEYRPEIQSITYDGRLDGMRYVFSRTPTPCYSLRHRAGEAVGEHYLLLYQREEQWLAGISPPTEDGPEYVGGELPWGIWIEAQILPGSIQDILMREKEMRQWK